jgi:hypothetical protein
MKARNLLSIFGITLLLVLSLSLASAAVLTITDLNHPSSVDQDAASFQVAFNLTNTGADANVSFSSTLTQGSGSVSIDSLELLENESQIVTATVNFNAGQTGNIAGTIVADPSGSGVNKSLDFSVSINEPNTNFCNGLSNPADLEVSKIDLNVVEGFGDDNDYWYPLDEVEIEFDIENKGDWDVENIEITLCLYDNDENECILDEDDMDLSDEEVDLDEGDDEVTIKATFQVDPNDLNDGSNDFTVYITAEGDIDDNNAGVHDGESICVTESENIEVRTEEFVVLDDITFTDLTNPTSEEAVLSCGSNVELKADVWNIGDNDLDSDEIYIRVYNRDLGINEVMEFKDVDALDSEEFLKNLVIPEDAEEKTYVMEFTVYDDDGADENDIYENDENDEAEYRKIFKVQNCEVEDVTPTLSAVLLSDAKVGEELQVQVSITNNGDATDFIVAATGFEAWATLVGVEPQIMNIAEGTTSQAIVRLTPTEAGAQTFKINAVYNGQTAEKTVSVNIAEKTGFLTGAFGGALGNTALYIIAAIVLILIIIVIVLIVKIAGSSKSAEF